MYRLVYYCCCFFGIGYLSLFIRMVVGGYWYAAITCILITLLVTIPLMRFYFKPGKRTLISLKWSSVHKSTKLRWARKGIAAFCCVFVVGAIQRQQYDVGFFIAGICILMLLPLDDLIFGPAFTYPRLRCWRSVRYITIVVGRNYGIMCYLSTMSRYIDPSIDPDVEPQSVLAMMIFSLVLIFIRPIVFLFAPERPPEITEVVPAAIQTAPLVETVSDSKEEALLQPQPEAIQEAPQPESEKKQAAPQPDLPALKASFLALRELSAQARGYAFQRFLYHLFAAHGLITRTAFRLTGEEIDGSFDLSSHTWLLEAKWHAEPTAQSDLLVFNSKVEGKSTWARGIFISYAGFSSDGLIAFRHGKRTSIIGMDGNDLLLILDGAIALHEAIKIKSMKAVENNDFFVPLSALITQPG